MAQKPNGLLLAALDANALAPLVETANSRGIKVVTFDSGINSDIPVSFVATNNRKAGAQAADALASQVNNKGKLGLSRTLQEHLPLLNARKASWSV